MEPPHTANTAALSRARSANLTPTLRAGPLKAVPAGLPPSGQENYIRNGAHEDIPEGRPPLTPTQKASTQAVQNISEPHSGAPVTGRAALVAAAAAGRTILEEGTGLSVFWPGSDEWYPTRILGHRAALEDGKLVFKHRCEYPGGFIEHDLGEVDFEVVDAVEQQQRDIDQENLENADINALEEGLSEPVKEAPVSVQAADKKKTGGLFGLGMRPKWHAPKDQRV